MNLVTPSAGISFEGFIWWPTAAFITRRRARRFTIGVISGRSLSLRPAAAASIMSFLKDLAQAANIAICCTIHQPSNAVFSGFDKIMLLSKGRVAYLGPASKTEAYFANIGYPVTSGDAIAEHMLNVVNAEFSDPKQVDEILDTYKPDAPGCEHTGPLEDVSNKGSDSFPNEDARSPTRNHHVS